METKSWKEIKDSVYGKKGTDRRDALDRGFRIAQNSFTFKKDSKG